MLKHGLSHDVSDDRDFNKLLDRMLVSDPNDPEVVKYLHRD